MGPRKPSGSTKSTSALDERGLNLHWVRGQVQKWAPPPAWGGSPCFARLGQWLAAREASGGIRGVKQERVANRTTHFAIYAVDGPKENENGEDMAPAEKLAQIKKRIDFIVEEMERAIANHEFQKARFYSDEERKERENLRLLRQQFNLEEPPARALLLCIEITRDERFSDVQKRCDEYIAEGVTQVWLLAPDSKRAYTVTKEEGLREFRGGTLQIVHPPLELDLNTIFD
jgi:hypothetical protein